jgi:hypothetical protein
MEATHAARRLLSSHPDYEALNGLQMMLCHAHNPHLACHNREWLDIEPLLMPSLIDALKTALGDLMDAGNFVDFKAAWARS